MRTGEHHWKIVLLVKFHHGIRCVIWRIVQEYNGALSPVPILPIHALYEVAEEELHHRGVGIGLKERQLDIAM